MQLTGDEDSDGVVVEGDVAAASLFESVLWIGSQFQMIHFIFLFYKLSANERVKEIWYALPYKIHVLTFSSVNDRATVIKASVSGVLYGFLALIQIKSVPITKALFDTPNWILHDLAGCWSRENNAVRRVARDLSINLYILISFRNICLVFFRSDCAIQSYYKWGKISLDWGPWGLWKSDRASHEKETCQGKDTRPKLMGGNQYSLHPTMLT